VILPNPKVISLPLVKVIELDIVKFSNALVLEKIISSCSALESLIISRSSVDDINVLRVSSRSLLSFKHIGNCSDGWDELEVAIDAPKLEYLNISDHSTAKFKMKNSGSLVEAKINIIFNMEELPHPNDRPKRKMIQDFLAEISSVKKLFISSHTLEVTFVFALKFFWFAEFVVLVLKKHNHPTFLCRLYMIWGVNYPYFVTYPPCT